MLYNIKSKSRKKSFPTTNKGKGKGFAAGLGAFNPNFDGNALAWYDGDVGLTALSWIDQGAGGNDIIFANLPTIVPNATPLRDAVRFDGINENGLIATPVLNQPYTIYMVLNTLAWVVNRALYDDGVVFGAKRLYLSVGAPNLTFTAGVPINSNPDLALGTWGVMTMLANGMNGEIRTNLNAAVVGNAGANNSAGITLGSRQNNTFFGNFETGYLILRTGADSTATQDRIINGLRNICGLTF